MPGRAAAIPPVNVDGIASAPESRGTVMSTVSAASDVGIAGSERDERGPGKIRRRTVQALGLDAARSRDRSQRRRGAAVTLADSEAVSRSMLTVPVAPASAALVPTAPTDGVLTMVIPPGAAA